MNLKIDIHKGNLNILSRLDYIKEWAVPESVKIDLFKFLDELASGKVNKGVQIADRTRVKYISLLKSPLTFLNKPINKLNTKDVEKWDKALSTDEILNNKKKPYTYNMKVDMRITLRTFLKWKLGESKSLQLTDFFDTRERKKTIDYLKESEIEKLYNSCKSNHERFLIAVLFDTGARAEEFLNIRFEDIQMPEGRDNFVKICFKEEYSKTDGRTITLYWRKSFEAVKNYFDERTKQKTKLDEQVYDFTYDSARFFLKRLGLKVLHKNLHFHLFRHSSATYYSNKMNRQELCYRYGWKFSSDMPDVYISRSGMLNKELDEKFNATEINSLKDELEKVKQQNKIENDELKKFFNEMHAKTIYNSKTKKHYNALEAIQLIFNKT